MVFYMVWTSSSGVIALAAVIFRNMVAFSNIDQMHTMFLHCLPPLACYMVRWHDRLTSTEKQLWGLLEV